MRLKIALLFFGLTRGLKHTFNSFKENLLDILEKEYDVDIYMHTYRFDGDYNNVRHGVDNYKLDFEEYTILNPKYIKIDDQDKVARKLNLEMYRNQPDIFKNNYQSNNNYILSLYSINEVTKLVKKNGKYKYCFYLRPDVTFMNQFKLDWLKFLDKPNSILIPNWDCFENKNKNNLNNRFSVIKMEDIDKYGFLLKFLLEYSEKKSIMAEEFLGAMLIEKYNMYVKKINFRFARTLPDGNILWRDSDIFNKK